MELCFNITGFLHFPSSFIWGQLKTFCKEVQRLPRHSLCKNVRTLEERIQKALPSLLPCFDNEAGRSERRRGEVIMEQGFFSGCDGMGEWTRGG